ncbi:MAG: BlaI/MecI/CopY family transcriptional regulator [Oscillospiraceae bacterium]|nr:BlaI/MecI/CopY family transcriptional regulator [Oscillospiraceae bacterium]
MKLTNIELEIMHVLWKSGTPMTATDIVAASPKRTWKETSIHVILRTLQAKAAVVLDRYIPTTGRAAAAYIPALTAGQYALSQIQESGFDVVGLIETIVGDEKAAGALIDQGWVLKKKK